MTDTILDENIDDDLDKFSNFKFRGKLAGKIWEHQQVLSRLKQTRGVIFMMSAVLFYPLLLNLVVHNYFDFGQLIGIVFFSGILFLAGLFFNRFRFSSILIAIVPVGFVLCFYLFMSDYFPLWRFVFDAAAFLVIVGGIYFHFKEKRLKKELIKEIKNNNPEVGRI